MRNIFLALLILLTACSPGSMEEFHFEGEAIAKKILRELQQVHSSKELLEASPRIKKQLNNLVDLMISARQYQLKHLEEGEISPLDHRISDSLKREFERIYEIEGCMTLMEHIERESVHKLDLIIRRQKLLKS